MSTRLSSEAYLDHLRADGRRLSEVARTIDLDAEVPSCPGWSMHDLLVHCGEVYGHKLAVLRLSRAPDGGEWPDLSDSADVVAAHDELLGQLLDELAARGPDADAWTWFPGEKTTGFWFRRMAQEAFVHRVDAELAAGPAIGPVDPVLAADGVDEVLSWFAGHPGVLAHSASRAGAAGEVYVDAGDHAFVVELPDDGHVLREVDPAIGSTGADAALRGAPADLDLHLWGRPSRGEVMEGGDKEVLERLYSRLHLAVSD